MSFRRFVEIGRICLVNYGEHYGKLVAIVDVVDQNRALVDAPDVTRQQISFNRLSLTDLKVDILRMPKKDTVKEAFVKGEVYQKWAGSAWGRKLEVRKKRAGLTDFDRFKIMTARMKRSYHVKRELAKMKKAAKA
ncbi:hypothetical protein CBR_g44545 [Chara braunii]|uniref:Large ribosomal subunit protein eL14 domain-containing protein n=1 Tax=Chara braunii TaxID=69332 RepID=A0A388LXZ8_CHABU|nr:hypothetical protein CBR_g44545 [Chara braunii]|eukprot:GBG87089.1 hypothetical protein CBR_g44545 [Chara braunii]